MQVSLKTKNETAIRSSDSTPGHVSGENSNSKRYMDFPGGPAVRNLPASAGDTGSIPGLGRLREAIKPVCHNY